jgi:uncharacterized RDD family membrane protein YckC
MEYPFPKASARHRFGQLLLEIALIIVTLGLGYLIWLLVVMDRGQTPGKQILKLRVYDETTGKPAKWGHMFIRELGIYIALTFGVYALVLLFGIQSLSDIESIGYFELGPADYILNIIVLIDAIWIFKGNDHKRLIDVICKTDVLNEAAN